MIDSHFETLPSQYLMYILAINTLKHVSNYFKNDKLANFIFLIRSQLLYFILLYTKRVGFEELQRRKTRPAGKTDQITEKYMIFTTRGSVSFDNNLVLKLLHEIIFCKHLLFGRIFADEVRCISFNFFSFVILFHYTTSNKWSQLLSHIYAFLCCTTWGLRCAKKVKNFIYEMMFCISSVADLANYLSVFKSDV